MQHLTVQIYITRSIWSKTSRCPRTSNRHFISFPARPSPPRHTHNPPPPHRMQQTIRPPRTPLFRRHGLPDVDPPAKPLRKAAAFADYPMWIRRRSQQPPPASPLRLRPSGRNSAAPPTCQKFTHLHRHPAPPAHRLSPPLLHPPPPQLRPPGSPPPGRCLAPPPHASDGAEEDAEGKSGFFGVRHKPSGNWGVEFSNAGRRWWIGAYPSAHEAAHAYDVAVWRAERPWEHLNFPEIKSRVEAEMLVPQGINIKEITTKKKTKKKLSVVINVGETDEEAMARFSREHSEYVQAKLDHYWKCEAEQKKNEDEIGPSTVIPIESSSKDD
ncbi:hypothetical protein ZWY2020_040982 [Hordeum vulgare]|nr:hypothetical protein ZWY2020_040982 [Hordeum vulgare]